MSAKKQTSPRQPSSRVSQLNVGQKDRMMDPEMRKTLGGEATRVGKLKALFGGLNPPKKKSK